ncbi:hypothetical protein D3Z50_10960 [Clostridiaceae bacterium]|nr:hypothetical protein [Clostridiaceae bacterium]
MKRFLVIGDSDGLYLENLAGYLMERMAEWELATFTAGDKLLSWLGAGNKPDILLVSGDFPLNRLEELAPGAVRILLSEIMEPRDGFKLIKKYQKSEAILNEMLLFFAEKRGSAEVLRGNSKTKIAVFYSPAGGCGTSTLALCSAAVCAREGMKTLYLNLEEMDSSRGLFPETPGSLSDLFLMLKTKGMNVGIKLAASVGADPESGVYGLNGVESILEYEEIGKAEAKQLLGAIRELADFDAVLIDTSSGFGERQRGFLEGADLVFTPLHEDERSFVKMKRWLAENHFHEAFNGVFSKLSVVLNQAGAKQGRVASREESLFQELKLCTAIAPSPVLADRGNLLRSARLYQEAFQPITAQIRSACAGASPAETDRKMYV